MAIKSAGQVRVHDACSTLGFKPVLVGLGNGAHVRLHISSFRGGEPKPDIRSSSIVIGHGGAHLERVHIGEYEIAYVRDIVATKVSPE